MSLAQQGWGRRLGRGGGVRENVQELEASLKEPVGITDNPNIGVLTHFFPHSS